jgi:hypothetical protein
MPDSPDIRTDNSEGGEGRGVAATRWRGFHYELPEDAVAGAFSQPGQSTEDLDREIRDHIAGGALEGSDLTGFWLAWHLASGFAALERGGWHRATIFRKSVAFGQPSPCTPTSTPSPGSGSTPTQPGPSSCPVGSSQPALPARPLSH